jgi:hypothetical protein
MKAEYEQRWKELAQDVLLEMRSWREDHPTAMLQEIEDEVDQRMARMRAGLVEGVAMSSTAVEVGSRAAEHPACCPTCGGVLQARGKQVRQLRTTGEQTVRLERRYGYCPTCEVAFFPPL